MTQPGSAGSREPVRVLIVDDHMLFRDGVISLLERDARFAIVGQADRGEASLAAAVQLKPDLVLMDIQMPGMGGLEATRRMITSNPDLKVIMLTVSEKENDLFEAVKAGAQGYLLKTATGGQEMRDALLRVAAGEAIIPSEMAPRLLAEFAAMSRSGAGPSAALPAELKGGRGVSRIQNDCAEPREQPGASPGILTPREHEVLELVARGMTNKEIAGALVISENTVRTHLRCILDKLHLNSRVQAAMWLRDQNPY